MALRSHRTLEPIIEEEDESVESTNGHLAVVERRSSDSSFSSADHLFYFGSEEEEGDCENRSLLSISYSSEDFQPLLEEDNFMFTQPSLIFASNFYTVGKTFVRLMGKLTRPFIIGVAGGTASGKTSVCNDIIAQLEHDMQQNIIGVAQDSFYRVLDDEELGLFKAGKFNFDHPDALDHGLMMSVMQSLIKREPSRIPKYDFRTSSRIENEFTEVGSADVILFEGILAFHFKELRDTFDLKIFVEADSDIRLSRRVQRDVEERGRSLDHVLTQYMLTVKPAFDDFCLPTKKYADVIIPRGAENKVGINLIVQHIEKLLRGETNGTQNGHGHNSTTNGHSRASLTKNYNQTLH